MRIIVMHILMMASALATGRIAVAEPSAPATGNPFPATAHNNSPAVVAKATAPIPSTDPWLAARVAVPWLEPSGEGVSIGYDNGSWGGVFTQGLRFFVPFGRGVGANLRPLALEDFNADRYAVGGRLELIGRSPVLLNLVRLYGGGGMHVFRTIHGAVEGSNKKVAVGGGGYFGFEFFLWRSISFNVEIGGTSGAEDGFAAGATVTAGIQLYPFK